MAASGGGHLRQLLDLRPIWEAYPHYFVTEDSALARSIAADEHVMFVPHFALGQARLGNPVTMLREAAASIARSFAIIRRHKPDLFITTGAGSQLFVMAFARLFGARVILVDSFARFHRPSAFARLAGRLAHVRIAQSAQSARHWPGALVFDPFRIDDAPRPPKDSLLFATVGATLAFPRLVALVDHAHKAGLLPDEVILQRGTGGSDIDGVRSVEGLPFNEIQALLRRADIVVCHGGTGSLITALREQCHVIAIPRSFERGEHYDNHQAEIVTAFAERGLIQSANTDAEFAAALANTKNRKTLRATTDPSALIAFLEKEAEALVR
ncbi:MAG: beta-1,4-glucuronosyltransferase WelK [Sphingomonas sp.]